MANIKENPKTFDLTGLTEDELIALHGVMSATWAWQSDTLRDLWERVDAIVDPSDPWATPPDSDEPPF